MCVSFLDEEDRDVTVLTSEYPPKLSDCFVNGASKEVKSKECKALEAATAICHGASKF